MATSETFRLTALELPGLSPDSLGNYLASLGILRILSRKWPSVRIAWHDDILNVVGGPSTLDELLDEFISVATSRKWTPYERMWAGAQKQSSVLSANPKTKTESGVPFALWQAEAPEELLNAFVAHVVPHVTGRSMNPVLGKAGKIGQRDFAKGWARAADSLATWVPSKIGKNETVSQREARENRDAERFRVEAFRKRDELSRLLRGDSIGWMEKDLNGASWFSTANKLYNSGQAPFRDGLLSPWAMTLACEGLVFLAGGASRRLSARSRGLGAFPFVTASASPITSREAGRDSAEFWAPIWGRPMTVPEVTTLYRRGRAELRGRGSLTPSAFVTAILRRGVDAGVTAFRRFVLGWTTAQDYVEPRFEGIFHLQAVDSSVETNTTAVALERVTAFIDQPRFPRDRKVGQRWRVAGVRGPIEAGLLRVAAAPQESENAIGLLDAIVGSLDCIDRNRRYREAQVSWEPLPLESLRMLFAGEAVGVEERLALSLISGFSVSLPFTLYRFGVEWKYDRFQHTERPPARWVWGPGQTARILCAVLSRRLLDEEMGRDSANAASPAGAPLPATCEHVSHWLDASIDERLLAKWLSRFALFDWRKVPHQVRALTRPHGGQLRVDGTLGLFGLLQPLVDRRPLVLDNLSSRKDILAFETGARTPTVSRSLISLIRAGGIDAALRIARSRYAMAGVLLARLDVPGRVQDPDRFLASLLFTISNRDRAVLIERWLRPRRRRQGEAHV